MVKLIEKSPAAGLLPREIGGLRLSEQPPARLTALAPLGEGFAQALLDAHGLKPPKPGKMTGRGAQRCLWFGHAHMLLVGFDPDARLSSHAAVTDQTDAWARVLIEGEAARDALARLVPLDLRDGAFPVGQVARTDVRHMTGTLIRWGETSWEVMVFRSMAATLIHDLERAARDVSTRA
ncbi:MAG: sarcosine oxidase subunit gamma [Shimia sp.]